MISEEKLYNKLYALFRLITIKYNIKIEDTQTFIKYVYAMDILWLSTVYRPFIWDDYIFIDDEMLNGFINKSQKNPDLNKNDFDFLAEIDHDFIEKIINESMIYSLKYNLPIDHIDHIPDDGKSYFAEIRENSFLSSKHYNDRLKIKRREIRLNDLLN